MESTAIADQDLEQLTNLFRLLSDKTRLNILLYLAKGECNVNTLCKALHLPQPTMSHHLGLLRIHGVIGSHRRGKEVFYALNGSVVMDDSAVMSLELEKYSVRIASNSAAIS